MLSRKELEQLAADLAAYKLTGGFAGLPEEVQFLLLRTEQAITELVELRSTPSAAAA